MRWRFEREVFCGFGTSSHGDQFKFSPAEEILLVSPGVECQKLPRLVSNFKSYRLCHRKFSDRRASRLGQRVAES